MFVNHSPSSIGSCILWSSIIIHNHQWVLTSSITTLYNCWWQSHYLLTAISISSLNSISDQINFMINFWCKHMRWPIWPKNLPFGLPSPSLLFSVSNVNGSCFYVKRTPTRYSMFNNPYKIISNNCIILKIFVNLQSSF